MGLIVLIWVGGFWLTFALLFWAALQGVGPGPWQAIWAAALWFITLPLGVLIALRLRDALPWIEAVNRGQLPIEVEVKVIAPEPRVWAVILAFNRRAVEQARGH